MEGERGGWRERGRMEGERGGWRERGEDGGREREGKHNSHFLKKL